MRQAALRRFLPDHVGEGDVLVPSFLQEFCNLAFSAPHVPGETNVLWHRGVDCIATLPASASRLYGAAAGGT